MSRPHTFAAACQPRKLVTASDVGGKRESASLTRKKEPAWVNVRMQQSVDELHAFSYGPSVHGDRDVALRRPARSADILHVSALLHVCMRVCDSVNVRVQCIL